MLDKSQLVEFSYKGLLPRSLVWNFPLQGISSLSGNKGRNLRYAGRGREEYSPSQEDL